jgi:hypothetical protein
VCSVIVIPANAGSQCGVRCAVRSIIVIPANAGSQCGARCAVCGALSHRHPGERREPVRCAVRLVRQCVVWTPAFAGVTNHRVPRSVPQRVPHRVPRSVPQRVPHRVPRSVPQRVPRSVPHRVPR